MTQKSENLSPFSLSPQVEQAMEQSIHTCSHLNLPDVHPSLLKCVLLSILCEDLRKRA